MKRKITFEEACRTYVHRYTMEHVPVWTRKPCSNGKFYAPQFRSDREWYENTAFPGEPGNIHDECDLRNTACYTRNLSWPLGQWLDKPYQRPSG